MKCIVTGGSGFIGSHLVDKLLAAGHEVAVLDLRPPAQDVPWLKADVREDLDGLLNGCEAIFHLAALANARKASENPHMAFSINVMGSLNLLQAARRADVMRVILASSAWVAGSQINDVVDESTPVDLFSVNTIYGATKLSQEMIFYSFQSEFGGPDYTILRYGIPFGERMWKGLVVRAFIEMAESSGTLHIMGDGKQHREFLYVGDLCEAQVMALDERASNKTYYLTGDRPVTVEELAQEVVKYYPARIEYIPQARIEPKLKRIDNKLVKLELGWHPATSLEEGIARCNFWWRGLTIEEKNTGYWT